MRKYSFIVPVYNTEKYLNKCIDSLLNQTYKNFEIIIIDNESTDNGLNIIKSYIKKHSNIILLKSKSSKVGRVRNLGIKHSSGDYFITIDSDDYVENNMLQIIDDCLINDYDIVRFNANVIENADCLNMFKTELPKGLYTGFVGIEKFIDEFIYSNKIFGPSWLYVININYFKNKGFKFVNRLQEDFGLIPQVIVSCNNMIVISNCLYNYVFHKNSITNRSDNTWQKAIDILYHYDRHIKFINKSNFSKNVKDKYKYYLMITLCKKYKKLSDDAKIKYKLELERRHINIEENIDNNTNI